MSSATNDSRVERLNGLLEPVRPELSEVESILRQEMTSRYPYVDELVQYGCLLGGKRLRPVLLLLTAKALAGETNPDHLRLAAVVEMIHTATLVHDDVLDEADLRRHLPTVNARWDNEASILLGDFLFSHAFFMAATLDSAIACQRIGRATNLVCEGEIRQKGMIGNFDLNEEDYLSIIQAKTGELCACASELGAYYANASENEVENMAAYGRELGIAFQIADDLLDVTGIESRMGKSLGTDLETQKPTLPVIHALSTANAAQRDGLISALRGGAPTRFERAREIIGELGSLDYTRQRAIDFASKAAARVEHLPDSSSKNTLMHICDFVVGRDN